MIDFFVSQSDWPIEWIGSGENDRPIDDGKQARGAAMSDLIVYDGDCDKLAEFIGSFWIRPSHEVQVIEGIFMGIVWPESDRTDEVLTRCRPDGFESMDFDKQLELVRQEMSLLLKWPHYVALDTIIYPIASLDIVAATATLRAVTKAPTKVAPFIADMKVLNIV